VLFEELAYDVVSWLLRDAHDEAAPASHGRAPSCRAVCERVGCPCCSWTTASILMRPRQRHRLGGHRAASRWPELPACPDWLARNGPRGTKTCH